jgi:hypothetical protein
VLVKKTKGGAKGRAGNKSARTRERKASKVPESVADHRLANIRTEDPDPADFAAVRTIIASLVRISAKHIAEEVIKVAKTGQLAPAKYLFEAVGLYPPGVEAPKPEDSLAYSLLKRMGLQPEAGVPKEGEKDRTQGRESWGSDDAK